MMNDTSLRKEAFLSTYEVKEKIGEGSGGLVMRAYHRYLQKDVVLKKIHAEAAEVLSKRAETDALKNLRHPCIPQVLDFIELDDGIYTVMDYIPGATFEKLIRLGRRFSQKEVIKYARQLFEVLVYIHGKTPKIIHGDIKPDNIILTPEDNICLIDFNISGIADESGALIEGYTGAYSAPEQKAVFEKFRRELNDMLQQPDGAVSATAYTDNYGYQSTEILGNRFTDGGTGTIADRSGPVSEPRITTALRTLRRRNSSFLKIDERADIYSAAATLYFILTGLAPRLENGAVIPPVMIKSDVSEGLNYILTRALEQDPDKRFSRAEEVLEALNGIGKLDSRYKRLRKKQNAQFLIAIAFICVGIVLISAGINIKNKEVLFKYDDKISAMEQLVGYAEKNDEFDKLYSECIELKKDRVDAYVYYALNRFRQGDYAGTIQYIQNNILSNEKLKGQSGAEAVYYMLGSSYFRKEEPDYEEAVSAYLTAMEYGNDQVSCYRELAECYLALDQVDRAESVLKKSRDIGNSSADMLLLEGEIAAKKGAADEAVSAYRTCIESSDDDEVTLRAYLGWNEALTLSGKTPEALEKAVEVLDKAQADLPISLQIQVLQSQAQNYIDLYNATGEERYAELGIDTIEKAVSNGWGNYGNYLNEAFLYQQLRDFDTSKEILIQLTESYPNYYITYLRLAFLEADVQKAIADLSQRDYREFDEYYHKSRELFYASGNSNNDLEMQLLEQMHDDAVQNGWIEN